MHPTDKAARIAGAVYLSMVVTGPFSLIYAPTRLIVRGNGAATANNILNHETLFRLWIIGDLWTHIIFICLGVTLYHLLNRVSKPWAVAMIGFVLVSAAVGFLNAFEQPQRNALGMFFLRLHSQGNFINEIFWGLWLFPFGLLVFRSGFLPRIIGAWLMINCFAWLVLSPIALFAPSYYDAAFRYAQPFLFGELAIMLWLLIKGAKVTSPAGATAQLKTA